MDKAINIDNLIKELKEAAEVYYQGDTVTMTDVRWRYTVREE